jgi:hypothetical protein
MEKRSRNQNDGRIVTAKMVVVEVVEEDWSPLGSEN